MNQPYAPAPFSPPAQMPGAPSRPATGPYPPHRPGQPGYHAAPPGPPLRQPLPPSPPGAYRPGPPPLTPSPGGHGGHQPVHGFAPLPPHPMPPQQPFMPGPPPGGFDPSTAPPIAPKRKRGRVIAAVVLVLAVGGGAAGAWAMLRGNGDQDAIIATMGAFNDAIAAGDVGAVTAQMCAEEAALLDGLELPAGKPPTAPTKDGEADAVSVGLADLQVKGAVAAATVTDNPGKKVFFRKEGEQWKVCSFAQADFDSAA